ncbi:hypothetical protein P9913_002800 [Citrobacter freundii]|uniref:hypothetical protein n=1 Tax=Citrobacter freundii TaxID=546 RepID=UPI002551721B|nr:hypothetical protein [Citrobacter freundii]
MSYSDEAASPQLPAREAQKKIPDQAGKRRTLLGMDNDYAVTGGINCFLLYSILPERFL